VQLHLSTGLGVGDEGLVVQEEHQSGSLPQLVWDGTLPHELLGLFEKIGGKHRAIYRCGTRHGTLPEAKAVWRSIQSPLSLPKNQAGANPTVISEHRPLSHEDVKAQGVKRR